MKALPPTCSPTGSAEAHGIVERQPHAQDGRRHTYRLTERGIELAPLLLEIIL
jgi:DNA-binding HxlR family transcriptional regulator